MRSSRKLSARNCASENDILSSGRGRSTKAMMQLLSPLSGEQTSRLPTATKARKRALAHIQIN